MADGATPPTGLPATEEFDLRFRPVCPSQAAVENLGDEDGVADDVEILELEQEVEELGSRIRRHWTTIPPLYGQALESFFLANRPELPLVRVGESTDLESPYAGDLVGSSEEIFPAAEDPVFVSKIQLLKEKVASNASALPVVLKRVNECIATIDSLKQYDLNIHPAFKRKRSS